MRTSQEGAGYTFNSAGGAYRYGVARPFEDKIRVAEIYLEMREINPNVSTRAVSLAASVGKKIATKVISEVESGALIDPRLQVRYRARGAGSLTISYKDGLLLLALQAKNNQTMLKVYSRSLYLATGKFVSRNTICQWFLTAMPFKGGLRVVNQVPIDKYKPENILRLLEFMDKILRINPYRLKFCDEKHLKGAELFNWKGRRDPITGKVEPLLVDSDWRNSYTIIGFCGMATDTKAFSYVLRDGMNNAAVFSETVIRMVATVFLRQGDVLVLDNAAIHHYQESTTLGDYLWYEHGILITFLPTRAPELNPIEQMWNILVQHLKNVALLGPGRNHSHQTATAAAMVMNEFTHLDVQACYISSRYLSTF